MLPTTFFDQSAFGDAKFAYFVKAQFDDLSISGISNFATVATASADLPATSQLAVCGDQDNPANSLDPLTFNCDRYTPVANLQLYQVPAGASALTVDFVYRLADFNNELAAFKVDDATGAIGLLHPGDSGYLAAALARAGVIFASTSNAFTADATVSSLPLTGDLHGGDYLVFFIVQNSTLALLKSTNPNNLISGGPLAFFTLNALNPDFFDHAFAFADGFGTTEFGWEDIAFGGDADFDDMVITVRGVTWIPSIPEGSRGPPPRGLVAQAFRVLCGRRPPP